MHLFLMFLLPTVGTVVMPQRRIDGKHVKSPKRYMVYLIKANPEKDDAWICGGAIVSQWHIVSSAACLTDNNMLYAVAGYHKYVPYENLTTDECTKQIKKKIVFTYVPKDYELEYERASKWSQLDIGVARVESQYDFQKPAPEACSWSPNAIDINYAAKPERPGTDVLVMGWGHKEKWYKPGPNTLNADYNQEKMQYSPLMIIEHEPCKEAYKLETKMDRVIEKYMICALSPGNIDDEGRPINIDPTVSECGNKKELLLARDKNAPISCTYATPYGRTYATSPTWIHALLARDRTHGTIPQWIEDPFTRTYATKPPWAQASISRARTSATIPDWIEEPVAHTYATMAPWTHAPVAFALTYTAMPVWLVEQNGYTYATIPIWTRRPIARARINATKHHWKHNSKSRIYTAKKKRPKTHIPISRTYALPYRTKGHISRSRTHNIWTRQTRSPTWTSATISDWLAEKIARTYATMAPRTQAPAALARTYTAMPEWLVERNDYTYATKPIWTRHPIARARNHATRHPRTHVPIARASALHHRTKARIVRAHTRRGRPRRSRSSTTSTYAIPTSERITITRAHSVMTPSTKNRITVRRKIRTTTKTTMAPGDQYSNELGVFAFRRSSICQNDHGDPLITWVGAHEVLIGVASTYRVSSDSMCEGPFLFTSTHCNSIFLDCIVHGGANIDPKDGSNQNICDRSAKERGYSVSATRISWAKHPDGPAQNES